MHTHTRLLRYVYLDTHTHTRTHTYTHTRARLIRYMYLATQPCACILRDEEETGLDLVKHGKTVLQKICLSLSLRFTYSLWLCAIHHIVTVCNSSHKKSHKRSIYHACAKSFTYCLCVESENLRAHRRVWKIKERGKVCMRYIFGWRGGCVLMGKCNQACAHHTNISGCWFVAAVWNKQQAINQCTDSYAWGHAMQGLWCTSLAWQCVQHTHTHTHILTEYDSAQQQKGTQVERLRQVVITKVNTHISFGLLLASACECAMPVAQVLLQQSIQRTSCRGVILPAPNTTDLTLMNINIY